MSTDVKSVIFLSGYSGADYEKRPKLVKPLRAGRCCRRSGGSGCGRR